MGEIDDLRAHMEEGFARVDRRIDRLGERIDARFDAVDEDHKNAKDAVTTNTRWIRFVGVFATLLAALGAFATPIVVVLLTNHT